VHSKADIKRMAVTAVIPNEYGRASVFKSEHNNTTDSLLQYALKIIVPISNASLCQCLAFWV
jgi:hypothetical protein